MNIFSILKVATWERFKTARRDMKKPITKQAERNLLKKLERFALEGQDINAVVEQSIERGWQGVFYVKREQGSATAYIESRHQRGFSLDIPTRAEERAERERRRGVGNSSTELAERIQERGPAGSGQGMG